jgi:hypothetical protein
LLLTLLKKKKELGQHLIRFCCISVADPVLESSARYAEIMSDAYLPSPTIEDDASAL